MEQDLYTETDILKAVYVQMQISCAGRLFYDFTLNSLAAIKHKVGPLFSDATRYNVHFVYSV